MRIFKVTATDLTHKISKTENIGALGFKIMLRSPRLHHASIIKSTINIVTFISQLMHSIIQNVEGKIYIL